MVDLVLSGSAGYMTHYAGLKLQTKKNQKKKQKKTREKGTSFMSQQLP